MTKAIISVLGHEVPVVSNSYTFQNEDGNWVVASTPTPWQNHIANNNWQEATMSLCREVLMHTVDTTTLRIEGYDAPLAVSAVIPRGYYAIKDSRIWVNEAWGADHAIDADGDRAPAHLNKDTKVSIVAKFPMCKPLDALTLWKEDFTEKFSDFGIEQATERLGVYNVQHAGVGTYSIPDESAQGITYSLVEFDQTFLKAHAETPVGPITNAWNTHDLLMSRRFESFDEKIDAMFSDQVDPIIGSTRFDDIESGVLKAQRKDGLTATSSKILERNLNLKSDVSWLWIGKNKIPRMKANDLMWLLELSNEGFRRHFARIRHLELRYNPNNPEKSDFFTSNPGERKVEKLLQEGMDLWENLTALGVLQVRALKPINEDLPPTVMIWMQAPDGTQVGLTDVKRNDRPEGLTYVFLCPPVWDGVDLYLKQTNADGEEVLILNHRATKKFIRADEFFAKLAMTIDNKVINPVTGQITQFWPKNMYKFQDPKYGVKLAIVQKGILEMVGKYGYAIPAERVNGELTYNKFNFSFVKQSVTVDYGQESTPEEMLKVAKSIQKQYPNTPICFMGSKDDDRRVRRYALANEVGGAIWSKPTSHPARTGKQLSQLARAVKECTMTVAIVASETISQAYVTPSGVEKQRVERVFMPRTYGTLAEFEEMIQHHADALQNAQEHFKNLQEIEGLDSTFKGQAKLAKAAQRVEEKMLTLAELDAMKVGHVYKTWSGQLRKCWIGGPRATISVGKIVDTEGNKLFLAEHGSQVYADWYQGKPEMKDIDLLLPYTELCAKGNLESFLSECTEEIIHIDGQPIKAMVGTFTFYRTGSGSENVTDRFRTAKYTGCDSLAVLAGFNRAGIEVDWKEEYDDATYNLLGLMRKCAVKAGLL